MRHDVGEVVAAARLQVDVVDRVGELVGRGDVVAGEFEATGRRLDPRREQQRDGSVSVRSRVAGCVERGQDPLRASTVAEDDPRPTEPVDDVERELTGRARRSTPMRRRCWRARLGRRRGARLGGRCAHPAVEDRGRVGEPCRVRGEGALGQPGVGHRFEREGADAVEQPVSNGQSTRRRRRR